jgi:outer membrane protein TolC
VGRAVEGRPEVGVAREAYQLKRRRARAARAELWPSLSLQAGYTLASPHDRYFPPRQEVNGSWDVSLVLSWRVWDWGATELEGRAADGEARAARARLRRVERATRLEVRQLAADVRAAEARVDSARRAVASARQALAMSRSMFEAGRVTTTEVLDSELQLAEARSGVVEARVDRRLAIARLNRVMGQPSSAVGHRSSGAPKR